MAYASLRAPTAWRCWTDTLPQSWPGHAEPVLSARFSVDGGRIVTASVERRKPNSTLPSSARTVDLAPILLLNILPALASQGQRPCRFSVGLAKAPHVQYLASGSIESLACRGADRRIKLASPAIGLRQREVKHQLTWFITGTE